jgi:hypothetical protein
MSPVDTKDIAIPDLTGIPLDDLAALGGTPLAHSTPCTGSG